MKRNTWWAKMLRIIGIVLMALTAAFTVMGGAGTSCVAFNPTGWGPAFAKLASLQWLYILFVVVTLAIGVMAVRATVLLARGRPNAYRYSLIALVLGLIVGGIHMAVSRLLRGSSMPVDMVVYTTALTLVVFLIFRIPGIWEGVNFDKSAGKGKRGGGAAAIVVGILALTIQYWMAPTHTINGINFSDVWHTTLMVIGWGLILLGLGLTAYDLLPESKVVKDSLTENA